MADKPVTDPLGIWRELVGQWEKGINTLANETMASDQFSGSVNQVMNLSLKMQQTLGETMAAYLAALNLPSRADVTAISERLAAIEGHLDRLVAIAEKATAAPRGMPARASMPPRTRKPPAAKTS